MPKSEWECLAGLELFESVGVGIRRPIGLDVEIIGQYLDDLADRAMSAGIRVSWIEVDVFLAQMIWTLRRGDDPTTLLD
jgi:hypothetical protein